MRLGTLGLEICEVCSDLGSDEELLIRKTKSLAGLIGKLHTCLAVGLVGAFDLGDSLSDDRLTDDHVGLALGGLGLIKGCEDLVQVMAVDHLDMPAVGGIASADILALADIQHGVEGDVVGIEENDEIIETEVTGKRGGLCRDTFLKTTIAAENDDMVVEDSVLGSVEASGSHLLRHRESHAIGHTLAERTSGRLDSRSLMELRVSGSDAVELTEFLHLIERKVEAGKVQPGVEEHATVTCGEDEPVSVDPARSRGVDLECLTEENSTDVSRTEGKAEMSGLAGSDGVDGESAGIAGG